jgi:DnaJ homolog subfamily B member 4
VKKFSVTRKRFNEQRELVDEVKQMTIHVKPGWKQGTKVTFVGEGEESEGSLAPDLIFVIKESAQADREFKRVGNNLVYTHKLSLADALTDCSVQVGVRLSSLFLFLLVLMLP